MLRVRLLAGLAAVVSFAAFAPPARAQVVNLTACNKGTAAVEVVTAIPWTGWLIQGETIAPGTCDSVIGR